MSNSAYEIREMEFEWINVVKSSNMSPILEIVFIGTMGHIYFTMVMHNDFLWDPWVEYVAIPVRH
jgi:hypothetical protein